MMKIQRQALYVILLAFSILISACGGGSANKTPTTAESKQTLAKEASPQYLIGPGDQLRIFVWGNPELSVEAVAVRPDGLITIPLVEDAPASGRTPTALARELEQRLSKFIKNPRVTVTVTQFIGRYNEQIRVVGQAAQPQALPYRENMTLLDVIIAVGGLTEFAAGNRASIVRVVDGERKQFRVRLDDLIRDGDISANISMQPGDVVIIPESWF